MQTILQNKEVNENVNYKFTRQKEQENNIEELMDGKMYQQKKELQNNLHISYRINTDGCQAADSSAMKIWPVYAMIHQLPVKLRQKYKMLIGLWMDYKEPDMNLYLEPIVDEANDVSENGVTLKIENKEEINIKAYLICCCVDSPARCKMLNMKKYNGAFGCTFCEHPTESVNDVTKYPMQENVPALRTNESITDNMLEANENNDDKDVKGV